MSRMPHASTLAAVLAPLIVALLSPRAAAPWTNDAYTSVPVCTAAGEQTQPASIPDGAGGLFVAWTDQRSGDWDIYAMRLTAKGQPSPGWGTNGVPVCTASGSQNQPALVSDDAGGVIVAWHDNRSGAGDIYAQHLTGAGTVAPGWPTNGMVVGAAAPGGLARDEDDPQLAADGAGGAFVVWTLVFTSGTDFDIYGNHVTGAGTIAPGWSATGSAIDPSGSIQTNSSICADGAGGVIIAYEDNLGGNYDIHIQRLSADKVVLAGKVLVAPLDQNGAVARSDGAGGVFVAFVSAAQSGRSVLLLHAGATLEPLAGGGGPVNVGTTSAGMLFVSDIAGDGAGGAYVCWEQETLTGFSTNLQHVLADGNPVTSWGGGGIGLPGSHSSYLESVGRLVPDGSGGVIAVYETNTGQDFGHLGAIRFLWSGAVANGWPILGAPICSANGGQTAATAVTDGSGGALAAWTDFRNGSTNLDIYANRIEHFGKLGEPEPALAGVKDVKNDQGGQVRVSWLPSYLDADPTGGIAQYVLFRQVPAASAQAAVRRGTAQLLSAEQLAGDLTTAASDGPRYLLTRNGAQTLYWEQVASVPANELPGYSLVTATTGDSTGAANPYTLFMVDAIGSAGSGYWLSTPDSGYSVDNLAPLAPAPFTGTYVPGTGAFLSWGSNAEPDLAGYRLYRGDSPGFVPGPSNLVAALATTSYADAGAPPAIYKLSGVDIHGNEGPFTRLLPDGTADAPGPRVPREVFLARVEPNPARGSATLRFGLPRDGAAELALYDAQGRRVRALVAGPYAAGEHVARWDGLDDAGHATASGIDFARLSAEGRVLTQRLVRVD